MSISVRITKPSDVGPTTAQPPVFVPSLSWMLADTQQRLNQALAVQRVHLTALRTISEALGNPYKEAKDKTSIDLAMLAADTLAKQAARIAELEAR